jgi:hypothetical protein
LRNDCENVNTHAHGDVHLVVLAHLRRRWSLSGREGFRVFEEMKRLFSITPKDEKGGEVAGPRNTRRTLGCLASDAEYGSVGR